MIKALRIASSYLERVATAENEVERLLKELLPGTPFANKAKAVGGYVRDQYIKEITKKNDVEPKDLDIVVSPTPGHEGKGAEDLTHLIHKEFPHQTSTPRQMGEAYPIWQVTFRNGDITYKDGTFKTDGAVIEFADTMKESYPDEKSRQRKVEPGTQEEDVERRDFTVNMLLKDLTTGEVEDLTGTSKEDIKKGVLRGHPGVSLDQTFSNDPLRMLRLVRFNCKYGWKVPKSVLRSVRKNAHRIEIVSSERIMGELNKIMEMGKLRQAVKFMDITGLLDHVMPEIKKLKGVKQTEEHHAEGDVYKHTLKVLENAKPGVENQLAALLHDVGKPGTQEILEDRIHFYGHENVSAEIAQAILKRLKFDNDTISTVVHRVKNHMKPHKLTGQFNKGEVTDKALRRFIREVGDETVDAIMDLAEADELGSLPSKNLVPDLRKRIENIRNAPVKMKKKPVLDGNEVMDALKIKMGPEVGKVLNYLKELEDDYASKGKELTKEDATKAIKEKFKD